MDAIITNLLREQPKSGSLFIVESNNEYSFVAFQLSCYLLNLVYRICSFFLQINIIQKNTKEYKETWILNYERKKDQIESLIDKDFRYRFVDDWKQVIPSQFNSIFYLDNLSYLNDENSKVVLSNLNKLDAFRHSIDNRPYFNSVVSALCTEEWNERYCQIIHSLTNCLLEIESDHRIRCTYKKSSSKLCVLFFHYSFEQNELVLEEYKEEKETVEESKDPSLVLHVQGETRFTTYPEEEDEVDIYTTHSDDEDFDLDDDLDI